MTKNNELTYAEQLQSDYTRIRTETRDGTITREERFTQIDEAVERYALAHAEAYAVAKEKGGVVPINFKNDRMLDAFADLALYEDLTWDHADKMSIIKYPIMSDDQSKLRQRRESAVGDVYTGGEGDETIGRSRDGLGVKRRIYDFMTPARDRALVPPEYIDLYDALDNAGLTQRQRQAINLIYFEGMTQEDAAEVMGVSRATLRTNVNRSISKLSESMRNMSPF